MKRIMLATLLIPAGICAFVLTCRLPTLACALWVLVLETSPDFWLDRLIGHHEAIIAAMKAFGLLLAAVLALRAGLRADRYNPAWAFFLIFCTGLMHGLYPGLSLPGSARSLLGSAAPFLFGFLRLPAPVVRAVKCCAILAPAATVGFGLALALAGCDQMYEFEQGALRLGASGEPPFLAGFALIGVYAGLLEFLAGGATLYLGVTGLNLVIILCTGARGPLLLGLAVTIAVLARQGRLRLLAALGALLSLTVMFAPDLTLFRVIDLARLGEAESLSNRALVWPYFQHAFAASPFFGWGIGAGKVIIPLTSPLAAELGTNAAHNEYLRIGAEGGALGLGTLLLSLWLWVKRGSAALAPEPRWFMRLVFCAFALHSVTDNTLIATTSSVFFLWVSAVFATASYPTKPAT
ncbi:MAG TPA: O-antigen ligase family protein [Acidocella sp.]|uniref:O-antigen ligase family protein n=1 Tax=Acidocella sp. TaxID=50710 RepID=UPI002BCA8DE5|nr:O-antigen ligase family protein [Acidocella sp.]HVE23025.1 O-antigen ligase family protein [Acidocella sp.]